MVQIRTVIIVRPPTFQSGEAVQRNVVVIDKFSEMPGAPKWENRVNEDG